jgi:hypothetical protein
MQRCPLCSASVPCPGVPGLSASSWEQQLASHLEQAHPLRIEGLARPWRCPVCNDKRCAYSKTLGLARHLIKVHAAQSSAPGPPKPASGPGAPSATINSKPVGAGGLVPCQATLQAGFQSGALLEPPCLPWLPRPAAASRAAKGAHPGNQPERHGHHSEAGLANSTSLLPHSPPAAHLVLRAHTHTHTHTRTRTRTHTESKSIPTNLLCFPLLPPSQKHTPHTAAVLLASWNLEHFTLQASDTRLAAQKVSEAVVWLKHNTLSRAHAAYPADPPNPPRHKRAFPSSTLSLCTGPCACLTSQRTCRRLHCPIAPARLPALPPAHRLAGRQRVCHAAAALCG